MIDTILYHGGPGYYRLTLAYILCQFAPIVWRLRSPSLQPPAPRPAGDPTWFLGVHVWGIESIYNLEWFLANDGGVGYLLPTGLIVLASVLVSSLGAEAAARRAGLIARSAGATVPASVLAIILGVLIPWAMLINFPPRMVGKPEASTGPHNKALHQTRRGGVAHFVRLGPVVEARLAGEGRCYACRPWSEAEVLDALS